MTLPLEPDKLTRFIHETYHEIARDEEMKDIWRDMVSKIIKEWEDFKERNLSKCPDDGHELVQIPRRKLGIINRKTGSSTIIFMEFTDKDMNDLKEAFDWIEVDIIEKEGT